MPFFLMLQGTWIQEEFAMVTQIAMGARMKLAVFVNLGSTFVVFKALKVQSNIIKKLSLPNDSL